MTFPRTPFFSVVTATYGRGRHIVPTIEAALDQHFADFELLVVGDGVDDDTFEHVPTGDPRMRTLRLEQNSGSQAAPNNAGIAAARGRFVAYLGHDDIWMPDHLAALADVLRATGCDVAVSGCAYHGPPAVDLVQVTGIFDDPDTPRRHFFPPTSVAHRRDLAIEIGGWREPGSVAAPVDADFLLRMVAAGARFASTGRVTAHKFAAGHRYLSYLEPSSEEQQAMLAAIRAGAVDAASGAALIDLARAAGSFMPTAYPDFSEVKAGEQFRRNRSSKGLDRAETVLLTQAHHVPQSMEPRALDWYPAETTASGIRFRWSGPSRRPKLLIPFKGSGAAAITLHLFDSDPVGIIDGIRLRLNHEAVPHVLRRVPPGRVDLDLTGQLKPDAPSVIEFDMPRSWSPAELGSGDDHRRLGVILTGFTIAPG